MHQGNVYPPPKKKKPKFITVKSFQITCVEMVYYSYIQIEILYGNQTPKLHH